MPALCVYYFVYIICHPLFVQNQNLIAFSTCRNG